MDYPVSEDTFTPFLGSAVRVHNGVVESKFYRKGTRKDIALHHRSHHPLETKIQTARNFYSTAEQSSSSAELLEQSFEIVDRLLVANGYENPREFVKRRTPRKPTNKTENRVCLKLPYVSETVSCEIRKFFVRKSLPIDLVCTPGIKLRSVLCSSRPEDKPSCSRDVCKICRGLQAEEMEKKKLGEEEKKEEKKKNYKKDCTTIAPVYQVTCKLCDQNYVGETCRTAHERLSEHYSYASNPTAKSYQGEALALHYRIFHSGCVPKLWFKILANESNTLTRKVLEALYIHQLQPEINNKDECKELTRFLI